MAATSELEKCQDFTNDSLANKHWITYGDAWRSEFRMNVAEYREFLKEN